MRPKEYDENPFPKFSDDFLLNPNAPWAPGGPFGPGGPMRSVDEDGPLPPSEDTLRRRRELDERRYVYFLQRVTDNAIKIGTSTRPSSRMYDMRAKNRCHVVLLATMAGGLRQEQLMHGRFARSRIDGEWFKPSRFLLAFIDKLNEEDSARAREALIKAGVELPPKDRA